ncbi:hypothetical protein Pse7367_1822 [Thalassoporum mexicanum PCC 7367]|uniref:hypothetical protein n=1 Tax=Thalassoporum mexicanum TaxID=3457544 RepID=UPI00029FA78E|nr:hypothetical protein [Pseudanabaena sp. PCC 7367]AFY70098.1 hypothetical protein Pse7367_1822 [Pseudanabaena sp. PCC 7367]
MLQNYFVSFVILVTFAFIGNSPLNQAKASPLHEVDSRPSSSESPQNLIAQTNPVYGCWDLEFSSFGVIYNSRLVMNGQSGIMRTIYFDVDDQRTQRVDQTMRLRNSSKGLLILGYNPVYAGTNRRYPGYSADNFLFQVRPNGKYLFGTCDDSGVCSPVEVASCD